MLDDKLTQYNVETEQVLKGIQPKNQAAYRLFKKLRALTVGVLILGILLSASKFIKSADFITQNDLFSVLILFVLMVAIGCLLLSFVVKAIFLRKVDFDYWAFEIFSKRLGSQVLYYTSSCIYVDYDISLKHKDILEAISECTDKSMYYTYFFVQTYIDSHVVCIEITKKKPLPESCEKTELETSTWNIIPFGLAVDELTQTIAPVGWFVTNDEKNDRFIQTSESVVVMVIGGTGLVTGQHISANTYRLLGTLKNPQSDLVASYNEATKTISLKFPANYVLEKGYKYRIKAKIKTTPLAEATYASTGQFQKHSNGSDVLGDSDTGSKSSNQKGFYSNDTAKVSYSYKGNDVIDYFKKPVIQPYIKPVPTGVAFDISYALIFIIMSILSIGIFGFNRRKRC